VSIDKKVAELLGMGNDPKLVRSMADAAAQMVSGATYKHRDYNQPAIFEGTISDGLMASMRFVGGVQFAADPRKLTPIEEHSDGK